MQAMKRVLFVDVRNTARGPMAEAWFNQLALGWGRASSCGTMHAAQFDMLAVQVMAEIGAPIRPHLPRPINQQLLSRANHVVIMGRDVPNLAFPDAILWNFPDPTGGTLATYRSLRNDILACVHDLIGSLRPSVPMPVPRPINTEPNRKEETDTMPIALGVFHDLADLQAFYSKQMPKARKGYEDEELDEPDTEKINPRESGVQDDEIEIFE